MSSVLIKGMEMPKNCNECKFGTWSNLHQTAACRRHDFEPCFKDHSREYMEKRAKICPLVKVPTLHGRLIDADALIAEYDRVHVGEPGGARKLMVNAPTIIEAEETE